MVNTWLGPYEIVEEIGSGGMATVYRAYQATMDRYVAVKVIHQSIGADALTLERFQREARLIARLENPHILPVYDFDGSNQPPYIVMRYVDGGTLKEALDRRSLPYDEIGYLMRQIASALDFAHRQGIIHRDVKPSNVLLDQQGNAFIADFGIARASTLPKEHEELVHTVTQAGTMVGTPQYMSPEQIMGRADLDYRTDIYALGVMLFEMLTGRIPYNGQGLSDILMGHMNAPIPSAVAFSPTLPLLIDPVFECALAKEAEYRYKSASELVEAAIQALGGAVARNPVTLRGAAEEFLMLSLDRGTFPSIAGAGYVDSQPPTTERNKVVTAVYLNTAEYAELVGEANGAEKARQMMVSFWESIQAIITQDGGTVISQNEENLLALWGIQAAREDDPERAVSVALKILDALTIIIAPILTEAETLPLRIGINTGSVLLSGDNETLTASGPTISVANRLAENADGMILISNNTYRHVSGIFSLSSADPLKVRGRKDKLDVYRVMAAKPRAFRFEMRAVEGIDTEMIGREAELKQLQNAFFVAVEDQESQVVTIVGNAGIGKSRLLYEFHRWMDLQETTSRLFRGQAIPEMLNHPFALLRDIVSRRFEILESDSSAVVRDKLEQGIAELSTGQSQETAHFLGHIVGFDFNDSPYLSGILGDPKQINDRARHYIMKFFEALAKRESVLVEMEDIHWADQASLDLFNDLISEHRDLGLLILCSTRPVFFEKRPAWGSGQDYYLRLDLKPLTKRDARNLVREILQRVGEIPKALSDLIIERAEGNPLYAEELIKLLVEDRIIQKHDALWTVELSRLSHVRVPPTLTGLLQVRLDSLLAPERILLQRACVMKGSFWSAAIWALDNTDGATLSDLSSILSTLVAREFIQVRETSTIADTHEYVFSHAMLGDVLYDSLVEHQRQAYHAGIARWLVQVSAERLNEFASVIAEHFELANQMPDAATWYGRAGQQAAVRYAYDQALNYFARSLDLLPSDADEERYQYLLGCDEIYTRQAMRNRDPRASTLEILHKVAERLDNNSYRAKVALLQGGFYSNTDQARSLSFVRKALQLAQSIADIALEAEATSSLAYLLKDSELLEKALKLARAAHMRKIEAECLNNLDYFQWQQGDFRGQYKYDVLAIAQEVGDRVYEVVALNNIGSFLSNQGDLDGAESYLMRSLKIAREIGYKRNEAFELNAIGGLAYARGNFLEAVALRQQSLTLLASQANSVEFNEFGILDSLAKVLSEVGELIQAENTLMQMRSLLIDGDALEIKAKVPIAEAAVQHAQGNHQAARAHAQAALNLLSNIAESSVASKNIIKAWAYFYIGLERLETLAPGELDDASTAFAEAKLAAKTVDLSEVHFLIDAASAYAFALRGDTVTAQQLIDGTLHYFEVHPSFSLGEFPEVYWYCHVALAQIGNPRAEAMLEASYRTLLKYSEGLTPEGSRKYLENVASHRDIVARWAALNAQ